jgi:hypothetical protein
MEKEPGLCLNQMQANKQDKLRKEARMKVRNFRYDRPNQKGGK